MILDSGLLFWATLYVLFFNRFCSWTIDTRWSPSYSWRNTDRKTKQCYCRLFGWIPTSRL